LELRSPVPAPILVCRVLCRPTGAGDTRLGGVPPGEVSVNTAWQTLVRWPLGSHRAGGDRVGSVQLHWSPLCGGGLGLKEGPCRCG